MIHAMLLSVLLAQDVHYGFDVPPLFIEGEPYLVSLTATVSPDGPAAVPAWGLSPAAFELDGAPLGARTAETYVTLVAGQTLTTTFDLGHAIQEAAAFRRRSFKLSCSLGGGEAREVTFLERAPRGIDFMTLPEEQLADYQVVMQTLAGPLWMELWPDVAPNHVRNFLDLSYTGFYDDNHFHRVVPGFMIQGGGATPERPAPRRLKNEFNERRHVPGVLSMARMGVDRPDEEGNPIPAFDSATSEFFVVHAVYPTLDGKYTAFGKLVEGLDVVEQIVHAGNKAFDQRDPRSHRPPVRQTLNKAVVVKAPKR